jgi:PAS domain S-box-containing protein
MLNCDPGAIPTADVLDFLDTWPDGLVVLDSDWRCRFGNRALETLLRRRRDDLRGRLVWEVLGAPEDVESANQLRRALTEKRRIVIGWSSRGRGLQVHVLPGADSITLLVRDESELQTATRALAESEDRYRTLFEQLPESVVVYGTDYRVKDCNESFARLLQSSRGKIIGLHIDDLKDQRHREPLTAAFAGEIIDWGGPYEYESTTSGVRVWLAPKFTPLRDSEGWITGAIVVVEDRTEQMKTQIALEESEARARQLVDALPDPVVVHVDRRVAYANPAAARLIGASSPAALIGRSMLDLAEPSIRSELRERMRIVLEDREAVERSEQQFMKVDGSGTVDVEVTAIPFTFEGHPAMLSIGRDLSDRKFLEARLVEGRRTESASQLVRHVAHDFRNMLLVILGNADMLLDEPENLEQVASGAREIRDAAQRGSALTRQLLFSTRRESLRPTHVELSSIVVREERLLRRMVGSQVQLSVALSPDAGVIHADIDQVAQVVVNLVVNARDAMPDGGTVRIETYPVRVPLEEGSQWEGLPPGVYATLAVRDTGTGMDETTRARIFEPYFTTKGPDRGTGLGLTIVADVVRESGGTIRVESVPGEGTSFVIYWPRATLLSEAA